MTRWSYRAARPCCSPGYSKGSTQRCCSYRHCRRGQRKRKVTGWLTASPRTTREAGSGCCRVPAARGVESGTSASEATAFTLGFMLRQNQPELEAIERCMNALLPYLLQGTNCCLWSVSGNHQEMACNKNMRLKSSPMLRATNRAACRPSSSWLRFTGAAVIRVSCFMSIASTTARNCGNPSRRALMPLLDLAWTRGLARSIFTR